MSDIEIADDFYNDFDHEVPMSQKMYFGLGNFGAFLMNGVVGASIVKFYNDIVGLDSSVITIVLLLFMVWNTINDPIFGYLSDSGEAKEGVGKRLPWMRRFNIPFAIFFALLWFSPIGDTWQNGLYFLIMYLLYDTCYTIVVLNFCALLADMTANTLERSRIQLVGGIFGGFSAIISLIVPAFFLTGDIVLRDFQMVMVVIALVCFVSIQLCAYKTKIRFIGEQKEALGIIESIKLSFKNKSFVVLVLSNFTMVFLTAVVTGSLFYYIEYVLGLTGVALIYPIIFTVSGCIVGAVLLMRWIENVGLKTGMLRGMVICGIGLISSTFLDGWILYVLMAFIGFGIIMPLLTFNVMVGELADEDEMKTGTRREGMFFGFNALLTKPAGSIAGTFIVLMLDFFEFVRPIPIDNVFISQPQTDFTIMGMKIMFGLVPGIFVLLGAWIFTHYELYGERLEKVKDFLRSKNQNQIQQIEEAGLLDSHLDENPENDPS